MKLRVRASLRRTSRELSICKLSSSDASCYHLSVPSIIETSERVGSAKRGNARKPQLGKSTFLSLVEATIFQPGTNEGVRRPLVLCFCEKSTTWATPCYVEARSSGSHIFVVEGRWYDRSANILAQTWGEGRSLCRRSL